MSELARWFCLRALDLGLRTSDFFLTAETWHPKPLSSFIIINIVAGNVYVFCFHQHRGKAEKRHFSTMCFQQHRGTYREI